MDLKDGPDVIKLFTDIIYAEKQYARVFSNAFPLIKYINARWEPILVELLIVLHYKFGLTIK